MALLLPLVPRLPMHLNRAPQHNLCFLRLYLYGHGSLLFHPALNTAKIGEMSAPLRANPHPLTQESRAIGRSYQRQTASDLEVPDTPQQRFGSSSASTT